MWGEGVSFDDVAIYFSAEEWETLEKWQKELYREVMVDHYQMLLSVGLMKVTPEIILRIMTGEEPSVNHNSAACVTAPEAPAPAMSPARPQGNTFTTPTPENNTSGTQMTLRHKKLNLPPEIFPRCTRQIEKATPTKSGIHENTRENYGDPRTGMPPVIDQGEKNYICVDCGKTFKLWSSLVRHTSTNSCSRTLSCSYCGAFFHYKSQLLTHQKTHSDPKPYECPVCGRQFLSKSSLTAHGRTHTDNEPFVCHLCNKSFTKRSRLQRHLRIHSSEKPFQCENCDKRFNDSSELVRHRNRYCPSVKGDLKKSRLVKEEPTDCAPEAKRQITKVDGGQLFNSLPAPKVMGSLQFVSQVMGDAKLPTIKELNHASGAVQEILNKDLKPLDTSDKKLHSTRECGGTGYGSVKTPVPETHVKGKVNDEYKAYLIFIVPPAKTSNIHTPNTRTTDENVVKDAVNCNYDRQNTSFKIKTKQDDGILLNSVCGPHEGPSTTNTNKSEGQNQLYTLRVKQECEDGLLEKKICESQVSAPPSSVKCEVDEREVTQKVNCFTQEELKTGENVSGFTPDTDQESPRIVCEGEDVSQHSQAKNQESSGNQKDGTKTRRQKDQESARIVWDGEDSSQHSRAKNQESPGNQKDGIETRRQKDQVSHRIVWDSKEVSQHSRAKNQASPGSQKDETKMRRQKDQESARIVWDSKEVSQHSPAKNQESPGNQKDGIETRRQKDQVSPRIVWDGEEVSQHSRAKNQESPGNQKDETKMRRQKDQESAQIVWDGEEVSQHSRAKNQESPGNQKDGIETRRQKDQVSPRIVWDGEEVSQHSRAKNQESPGNQKDGTKTRRQKRGTDNKKRTCNQCGESFIYDCRRLIPHRCSLKEILFECDCGKRFQHSFQLEQHQKAHSSHKSYKCNECEKAFGRISHLILHIRSHVGNRSHLCSQCGKDFNEFSKLQRHLRIHTGEKPFHCDDCGKSFNDCSVRNRHSKTHNIKA
ncbi:uncharacterized protein LOC142709578 [Rhinoderma darwinii]|uniref:uncharacterized protein LOC142709578 n=1 Tax=Rhinoderma darwinii TaxID=43563 RepID=UPI003F668F5E